MKPGLYEQIINKQMNEELQSVPEECRHQVKVDSAEASRVLATYAAELMKRKMDAIYESSGDQALSDQIAYINKVIGAMDVETEEELQIEHPGEQLLNLLSEKDEQRLLGKKAKDALRPETSMAYSSLFTGAAREPQMLTELKKGFVSVPKGCYIYLEKKASEYVLQNIRSSIETRNGIVAKIASYEEDTGKALTLGNFLDSYRMDPRAIYKKDNFARLCVYAGVKEDFEELEEKEITKALARLASIDSRRLLQFIIHILPMLDRLDFEALDMLEKRMLQMFYVTVWMDVIDFAHPEAAYRHLHTLAASPVLRDEMLALMQYRYAHIDILDQPLDFDFACPIDLHCTYSRDQLLVALDFMKPSNVREGVKWLPEKKLDVLFVTLNKSDKDYSPTTMYQDYSINKTLFHWQSQSTTSDRSKTGQRYIHHRAEGSRILLCVRDAKKDAWGGTASYSVLGFVDYVQHTGSNPMSITWRLVAEIPAKYIKKTNKLIVS